MDAPCTFSWIVDRLYDTGSFDPFRSVVGSAYNAGLGVYAAKVPLIMGKAAVLAYVAGPTLRSMRVARWPGNTAAGPVVKGTRGLNAQAGEQR